MAQTGAVWKALLLRNHADVIAVLEARGLLRRDGESGLRDSRASRRRQ